MSGRIDVCVVPATACVVIHIVDGGDNEAVLTVDEARRLCLALADAVWALDGVEPVRTP